MMAFSGVRNSCDMVARNSDFIRLACSSSMFFSCSVCSKRLRSVVAGGFDLLAHRVVGADQQVADDLSAGVAQRGHRHDGREPAAVLAHVGQLVDVLDAARGLEHQRLEAGRDRGVELQAERRGARDQFLRVRDVGRGDLVDHVLRGVAEHPLGADVEDLDHALFVGGDAGEVGAVEDGVLQGAGLERGLATRCDDGFGVAGWRSPWAPDSRLDLDMI